VIEKKWINKRSLLTILQQLKIFNNHKKLKNSNGTLTEKIKV